MSRAANLMSRSLLLRSVVYGLNLGVAVFLFGRLFGLWPLLQGTYVIGLIVIGSVVLLPLYEKLARLQTATDQ
ncbi:MAG: hypothetical protein ACR2PZ_16415 [Pseudomonadales bacterium]